MGKEEEMGRDSNMGMVLGGCENENYDGGSAQRVREGLNVRAITRERELMR